MAGEHVSGTGHSTKWQIIYRRWRILLTRVVLLSTKTLLQLLSIIVSPSTKQNENKKRSGTGVVASTGSRDQLCSTVACCYYNGWTGFVTNEAPEAVHSCLAFVGLRPRGAGRRQTRKVTRRLVGQPASFIFIYETPYCKGSPHSRVIHENTKIKLNFFVREPYYFE